MLKIGIITAFSNEFPFMARDFAEGLKFAFNGNEKVSFVHIETERGLPNEVSPLFRKLIINDEVNLIVGMLDSSVVKTVKELITQTCTPLILGGMGVRLPVSTGSSSPFIFYNSYRIWESCWLSGKIAAEQLGKRLGVFSSFFDSGFPLVNAHTSGAAAAGAQAVFFNITHKDKTDDEMLAAQLNLNQTPADYYFMSYYGKERASMFNWLESQGVESRNIVASSGIQPQGEGASTVSSWFKDNDLAQNKAFVSNFKKQTGHETNEFSMLGYENGILIRETLKRNEAGFDSFRFVEELKQTSFTGPRGKVSINPLTQSAYSDHYFCGFDSLNMKKYTVVSYPAEEIEKEILSDNVANLIGWQNNYLCK
jgi:ABC-type branched-subunit amino acid transport system substrate-binding protein